MPKDHRREFDEFSEADLDRFAENTPDVEGVLADEDAKAGQYRWRLVQAAAVEHRA